MIHRRALITGLISLVAAPAIVRAGSLMPVRGEGMMETDIAAFIEAVLESYIPNAAVWGALPLVTWRGFNDRVLRDVG